MDMAYDAAHTAHVIGSITHVHNMRILSKLYTMYVSCMKFSCQLDLLTDGSRKGDTQSLGAFCVPCEHMQVTDRRSDLHETP